MADIARIRPTILVVEDDAYIRLHAANVVRDDGLQVLEAADAVEALALLKGHPEVAVLFTDIEMDAGMDGVELAERVHTQQPKIQLLLTSASVRPPDETIPDDGKFLAKPYTPEALTGLIRELLARPAAS